MNNTDSPQSHIKTIWRAGVNAVDSRTLIHNNIQCSQKELSIAGQSWQLADLNKIVIVGGGKAGAGMALGIEEVFGDDLVTEKVTGWVNVPADCVDEKDRLTKKIHLHPARPAGVNEPTAEGVLGTDQIFELVSQLGKDDLCIVLLSGGGSALLPAPVNEISLTDKIDVTQQLMQAGATINELNIVRKQLSRIKGGGLALAAAKTTVVTLIISDVIDDPLDIIASGPTVYDSSTPQHALDILERYDNRKTPYRVSKYLQHKVVEPTEQQSFSHVTNHVIGNNRVALLAAKTKAEELGYHIIDLGSNNGGVARDVGVELAKLAMQIRDDATNSNSPTCLLSGGEPVVHLIETDRLRKGGRNQELVLAALEFFWDDGMKQIVMLSGGTDGEDGPTNAAGAIADSFVINDAHVNHIRPADFLAINNSYPFFETLDALLKTGPTHTNVMDLRVVLIEHSG